MRLPFLFSLCLLAAPLGAQGSGGYVQPVGATTTTSSVVVGGALVDRGLDLRGGRRDTVVAAGSRVAGEGAGSSRGSRDGARVTEGTGVTDTASAKPASGVTGHGSEHGAAAEAGQRSPAHDEEKTVTGGKNDHSTSHETKKTKKPEKTEKTAEKRDAGHASPERVVSVEFPSQSVEMALRDRTKIVDIAREAAASGHRVQVQALAATSEADARALARTRGQAIETLLLGGGVDASRIQVLASTVLVGAGHLEAGGRRATITVLP